MIFFFPGMLGKAAEDAGIPIPEKFGKWDKNNYPHWTVLTEFLIGREIGPNDPDDYAKIIVKIPDDQIRLITFDQLEKLKEL